MLIGTNIRSGKLGYAFNNAVKLYEKRMYHAETSDKDMEVVNDETDETDNSEESEHNSETGGEVMETSFDDVEPFSLLNENKLALVQHKMDPLLSFFFFCNP